MLIEYKEDLKKFIQLRKTIINDDSETVAALLEAGLNPNGYEDANQFTPLHMAALYGADKSIPILLGAGANLHAMTDDGISVFDMTDNEETLILFLSFIQTVNDNVLH